MAKQNQSSIGKQHPDLFAPLEQALSKTGDDSGAMNQPAPVDDEDARDPTVAPNERARSSAAASSDEQMADAEEVESGVEASEDELREQAAKNEGNKPS